MTTPKTQAIRSLFLGGILPVVIYTILEEKVGSWWALVFGMVFGGLEILFEYFRFNKVQAVTWIGNGLLLGMGAVSLLTEEGVWFKMQPAFLEAGMALVLIGSCVLGKPLLVMMGRKESHLQHSDPALVSLLEARFSGITWRLGFFFLAHAALATYAAFYWSTRAWALLKGLGLTLSMILILGIEIYFLRRKLHGKQN